MEEKIKAKLEELRVGLQADGGDLEFVKMDGKVVYLKLVGHCGSCPFAMMTLKQGIEAGLQEIDPEITAAVERAAAILEKAGAEVVPDVPMPNTKYSVPAYFVISRIEAYSNLQRYDGLKYGSPSLQQPQNMYDLFAKSREEGFGHEVKLRILSGLFLSQKEFYEKYYLRAQRARARCPL